MFFKVPLINNYIFMKLNILFFLLLTSTSSFSQSAWFSQLSDSLEQYCSVQFINSNTGFVARGFGKQILKSTNSGANWFEQLNDNSDSLQILCFPSESIGFGSRSNNKLKKTTNGGDTWFNLSFNSNYEIYSMQFIDVSTGWVVGGTRYPNIHVMYKTTNAGVNWNRLDSFNIAPMSSFFFLDSQNGWRIRSDFSQIQRTSNGGLTWFSLTSISSYTLYNLQFVNLNTGWLTSKYASTLIYSGDVFKTTNGGLDWFELSNYTGDAARVLFFKDINTGWVMGNNSLPSNSFILATTNGGDFWVQQYSGPKRNVYNLNFINANTGWACIFGNVLKTITGGFIGINNISKEIPTVFSLFQNFPNPFNSSTNIIFDIPKSSSVKLSIFDILGREIEVLVDENIKPGSYQVDWNASAYSSGIYYYKIEANNFTKTRKMLLIK